MSSTDRRAYKSEFRRSRASETRKQILKASIELFRDKGVQKVTINEIAEAASVSAASIYAIFKSKKGVLRQLLDEAFAPEKFQELIVETKKAKSPQKKLALSAKIARQMYDAEKEFMELFTEAAALDSDFQEAEKLREERRYQRQQETVELMAKEQVLPQELSLTQARDILWAFTGRDMYRLFVIERKWSSDQFEAWLAQHLVNLLIAERLR